MVSKEFVIVGILISSLVGFSNFDAFAQTNTGVLVLDPFLSSAQVDDIIIFSGTLNLDNKNSEKPMVYIKNARIDGEDNLLIMAYVNNDGTFSARWTVKEVDEKNNLKIYAFYEGERKLSKLTTCYKDQTNVWSSMCPHSRSFTIIDGPTPIPYSTNQNVGDEYIKFFYALDFSKRPIVAIVPSPTSYDKVKSHISAVKEGLSMLENQMTGKYEGNWKINFQVIEPGENYSSLEPDVVMNIVTEKEDPRCLGSTYGWASVYENVQKPIITSVCSYNYEQKNSDATVSYVAAHEFVHAIGVGHTFGKLGDMMCSSEYVNGKMTPTCPFTTDYKPNTSTDLHWSAIAELYGTDGFKGQNNIVEYKSKFSGEVDSNSFTYDRDRDGIHDNYDQCPSRAEDYNGIMDWDGCPDGAVITSDADHDGIPNEFDRCPTAAEIYNDFEDEDGCPDYPASNKKSKKSLEPKQVETIDIPNWIRNNVKWWVVGSTASTDFTSKGVVYMINEEMIHLESPVPYGKSIYFGGDGPNWFKAYAEAWADGEVTNTEFLEKIQILIDTNVLRIR